MIEEFLQKHQDFESRPFRDKKDIIHIFEIELRSGSLDSNNQAVLALKRSPDLFKRIIYYLFREYSESELHEDDLFHVRMEYEKINANKLNTLTALHYSIRLVKTLLQKSQNPNVHISEIVYVLQRLQNNMALDKGGQIKANLRFILQFKKREKNEINTRFLAGSKSSTNDLLLDLIAKGESFKALRLLLDQLEKYSDDWEDVLLLSSRLKFARNESLAGLTTYDYFSTELNKINQSFVQLLKRISY